MEFLLLIYFLLTLGYIFAVLAERNRKEQAKRELETSSNALRSPSRGEGMEAEAPA